MRLRKSKNLLVCGFLLLSGCGGGSSSHDVTTPSVDNANVNPSPSPNPNPNPNVIDTDDQWDSLVWNQGNWQ
ncbi:MAG: hypothetical protein ACRBCS_04045 [Cellvibrionaceae bacterium]